MRNLARQLLSLEIMCVVVGFSVPLLEWCIDPNVHRNFGIEFLFSFVYSNTIGFTIYAVMPWLWERSLSWNRISRWIVRSGIIVLGTTIGCLLGSVIGFAIWGRNYDYWAQTLGTFKLCLLVAFVVSLALGFYEQTKAQLHAQQLQLKMKELERERALKLATEARLASLESRIHPHFLFNTINSVSSLIHEDPERADQLLTQMAALLRFSLDSAHTGLVPIERELKIVTDYLSIEKARFGDRLRYDVSVAPEALAALVPPLSIQTLVENSLKYAMACSTAGARVRIVGEQLDGSYVFTVLDDGPGFESLGLSAGHGLSNLTDRLRVIFGERGSLFIRKDGNWTTVSITVPVAAGSSTPELLTSRSVSVSK
jgi:sensor histidine kinase YesM